MATLTVTPHSVSASEERGAIIAQYVAAEDITLGQAVYLNASNQVLRAKADSSAHANAIGVAAISDNFYGEIVIASGGTVGVVVYGPVWGFSALVSGNPGWVGATAGEIVDTAPTGGAYQFVVGHAIDAQTFFVDPGTTTPASHA